MKRNFHYKIMSLTADYEFKLLKDLSASYELIN